jgi:hypothetical protein
MAEMRNLDYESRLEEAKSLEETPPQPCFESSLNQELLTVLTRDSDAADRCR